MSPSPLAAVAARSTAPTSASARASSERAAVESTEESDGGPPTAPEASGVTATRAFDPGRLERMFVAHHQLVWRTFRRLGFDEDSATDATQQVFLIAAERLADIREPSERAFLFSTTLRLSKTLVRKRRRVELTEDMDVHADPTRSEQRAADRRTALELLDRVLARMDQELVLVFVLYEVEGLSTPELAELLAVPLGTAASRLRRARQAFREAAGSLDMLLEEVST